MSSMSRIKEIVYELLAANGRCSLEEIKKVALERNIEIPPESTLIRSTIYQLAKKDSRIQRAERGVYRWAENSTEDKRKEQITGEDDIEEYLKETEIKILEIMEELKNFNWFESSDSEVARARNTGIRLKKFYDAIDKEMKDLFV